MHCPSKKSFLTAITILLSSKLFAVGCAGPQNDCAPPACCFIPPICHETYCGPKPDCDQFLIVEAEAGLRRDRFFWSTSGKNGYPPVLHKENYKKLLLVQVGGNARYIVNEQLVVKVRGDYARTYRGTMQESDYGVIGAQLLRTTQYNNISDSGRAYGFSGSLGWQIPIFPNWLTLVAEAGYSQDVQYLKAFHSVLALDLINDENGRIHGRRSRTRLSWIGPWAGGELALRFCSLKLTAACEYHWAHYKARGQKHLGGNCVNNCTQNIQQKATAFGVVGRATISQTFYVRWTVGLSGVLQYWKTRSGRVTYTKPRPETSYHLNPAKWTSASLCATLAYRF